MIGTMEDDSVPVILPQASSDDVSTLTLVKRFVLVGTPLMVTTLAQFTLNAVMMAIIGKHFGVKELGGVSLALGMLNATAFAFSAGLCGALETVLSQTYGVFQSRGGEGTMYLYGTYTQRMAVMLLVISIPIGIAVIYIDVLLKSLGERPEVVYYTGRFCCIAALGIPALQFSQLISRYLSCQHQTAPLSAVAVGSAILNPILQHLFIRMFGFNGSPMAWVLLYVVTDVLLVAYTYYTKTYVTTWGGWDSNAVKNLRPLVNLAAPSLAMSLVEWVVLEVIMAGAGFAPPTDLAAFSITVQVFSACWGVASGTMLIVSVFIGNAIGEGKPLLAKRIANIAIVMVGVTTMLDILLCWKFEDRIPLLFSDDKEVGHVYRKLMRFVFPYHAVDTFQSTVMGILRGCGLQKIGAVIIGVTLCVVGAPLAFFLFFYVGVGVEALWIGPLCSVTFVGVPLYIYLLYWYIDWSKLQPQQESLDLAVEPFISVNNAPLEEDMYGAVESLGSKD
ncbi:MATE efflux family protein [Trypanosoma brucei equiperdum]|uniref:MATE efflux family protein n=1 Tax=Trypanosoma brucei equiperdum TaxID=630700 RepID=A0A3L6L0A7_9TRYP|nr:MATE efflux family protein [Trypanosoma brucei equiperdum]